MSNLDMPLINGTRRSFGSIRCLILGRVVTGFKGIKYTESQEKTNVYGSGYFPVARRRGNYKAEAEITLDQYEVDAIQKSLLPGQKLTDIKPFDIIVTYLPEGQDKTLIHTIRNCEFTENLRDVKQNDQDFSITLKLIVSDILWL